MTQYRPPGSASSISPPFTNNSDSKYPETEQAETKSVVSGVGRWNGYEYIWFLLLLKQNNEFQNRK